MTEFERDFHPYFAAATFGMLGFMCGGGEDKLTEFGMGVFITILVPVALITFIIQMRDNVATMRRIRGRFRE